MRLLLFFVVLAVSLPARADSLWGDYGDVGPSSYNKRSDDYLVYGSPSQQLWQIESEIQYQAMRERRYQREVLEEMRESNRIAQEALEQQERNSRRNRPLFDDF